MTKRSLINPKESFAVLAIILVTASLYSRFSRRITLGDEFQYVPRESVFIVAAGDIESLWLGLEKNFGRPLKAFGKEDRLDLKSLVGEYGIDIHRGAIFTAYRASGSNDESKYEYPYVGDELLFVLPITNQATFLRGLKEYTNKDLEGELVGGDTSRPYTRYKVANEDGPFVSFPQAGIAVISSSPSLLHRSLTLCRENLAHISSNDTFFHAVKRRLRAPLLVGPNVFVYWQSRTAPFSERVGVLRIKEDGIEVEADVDLAGAPIRALDNLRRPTRPDIDWAQKLPHGAIATLMMQDEDLSHYKNILFELLPKNLRSKTGFNLTTKFPEIRRLLIAITDFEDGLPDVVVGLWGDQKQLEAALGQIQHKLRQSRDLELLNGALQRYRESGGQSPSLADLERLSLLEHETLFDRYRIRQDGTVENPEFKSQDFLTEDYSDEINGHSIRFLAPSLGENDRIYRDLEKADRDELEGNRYRLASLFLDDALWIATDVGDLELLTKSDKSARTLESAYNFRTAAREWSPGSKLRMFVDVERLIPLALLGTDNDELSEALLSLSFSSLSVEAVPSVDHQRIVLQARLRQGNFYSN